MSAIGAVQTDWPGELKARMTTFSWGNNEDGIWEPQASTTFFPSPDGNPPANTVKIKGNRVQEDRDMFYTTWFSHPWIWISPHCPWRFTTQTSLGSG